MRPHKEEYLRAGLTPDEVTIITTPLGRLTPQARQLGTIAWDKYIAFIAEENKVYKAEKEAAPKQVDSV